MLETRYEGYAKSERLYTNIPFPEDTNRWVTQLVDSINKGSQGRLMVDQIENIGPHCSQDTQTVEEKVHGEFRCQDSTSSGLRALWHGRKRCGVVQGRKWEVCSNSCPAEYFDFRIDVLLVLFHLQRSRLQHQTSWYAIITPGRKVATKVLEHTLVVRNALRNLSQP
jgi:hypothetical protein